MKSLLLVVGLSLLIPLAAWATPYVPIDALGGNGGAAQGSEEWVGPRALPAGTLATYDPYVRYGMCCDFVKSMQVSDTSTIDYGGIREAEHMLGVIQSDNTSESIWLWSHYYRLSGTDTYHGNVAASWQYIMNHPAYNEEGDDSPVGGYYRRYNCSWSLRAVMEYSDVYGDATYAAYGDSCASYLCHHPMKLNGLTGAARRLNGMVMGWAVGNLYEYGQYIGNPTYCSKALDMADSVKGWVDSNPAKLHWKEWAMEGGSAMWGIVHSFFANNPTSLKTWVTTSAPYLDTEVLPSDGAYQNAWRAWGALGQSTASQVLDSPTYGGYFKHLADTLVANDEDNDGGIPVLDADPDNYDQSWVTSYLAFMCMNRLLVTAGTPVVAKDGPALDAEVSPVPSVGMPRLAFNLPKSGTVKVSVYDAAGRRVMEQDLGTLGSGFHRVDLGVSPGFANASPGIYFYEVRTAADVATGKMVVLR
ncbi:MAG TPA: T9SS type A sorting domain-containing protein [bacterium]|nr:T9SS type A sorting domain-containing protein [bacterium]